VQVVVEQAVTGLINLAGHIEYLYDIEQTSAKARLPIEQRKQHISEQTKICKTESKQVKERFASLSEKLTKVKPQAAKVVISYLIFHAAVVLTYAL
jgi:septation ring formation regulator EzrA